MNESVARLLTPMPSRPIATIAIAIVMAIASLIAVVSDGGEGSESQQALVDARTFYEQNAEVSVSERNRQLLGPDFVDVVASAYAQQKDLGAGPIFSARMQDRTQKRFEKLADTAFEARMSEFPAWRYGIAGSGTAALNHVSHVFVHASMLALAVSLVFFVLAGIGLEAAWGALAFAGFCLLGALVPSIAFRMFDFGGGVPLAGATGLVGAVLGAYLVRGLRGTLPLPGWVLLPVWGFVELFFVRGIWIDNVGSAPWVAMGTGVVLGVAVAAVLELLNLEAKLGGLADRAADADRHPALAFAAQAMLRQDPSAAWKALATAREEAPEDREIVVARFLLACELGRIEEVVEEIVPVLKERLKKGATAEAVSFWRPIVDVGLTVDLPPAMLVRLGEGLLDEGHPAIAVETLRRALDHETGLSTSLARRVVRVARDLDPTLTHRAALIALEDPELDPASRTSLEELATMVRSAIPSEPASTPAPVSVPAAEPAPEAMASAEPGPTQEKTRFPVESDIDVENVSELTDPDEFASLHAGRTDDLPEEELDPNALSIASIERELASGAFGLEDGEDLSDVDPAEWNDPGLRPELSADDASEAPTLFGGEAAGDHVDNAHLDAGALSPEALAADPQVGPGSGSDTAPLALPPLGASEAPASPDGTGALPPLSPGGATPLGAMADALLESPEADTAPITTQAANAESAMPSEASAPVVAATPAPAPVQAIPAAPATPAPLAVDSSPFGDDDLDTDFDLGDPPLRPLKLVVGVPIGAKERALELEVEGKGVSRVPFDRIEAVAVAAVSGLSEKPVLIVDLVLNWLAGPDEPLKVVRFHSNRFDPTRLVPDAKSSLDALRSLVASIIQKSGASPLPDETSTAGAPFARHPDSASYEREVLGAEV